MTPKPLEAI